MSIMEIMFTIFIGVATLLLAFTFICVVIEAWRNRK